ncbi:MAG: hypothetical protein OHK0029_42710 [Armatimonadaceae bacterium]
MAKTAEREDFRTESDESESAGERQEESVKEEAEERRAPGGKVIYHAIFQEGEEELDRSSAALFWSGLAAGLSMGFSLIAEGLLQSYLPDAPWHSLVSELGYSLGFIIVILGRQQLFTENTLTPILPLLKRKDGTTLLNVLRLWGVVLLANLIGAVAMAWLTSSTGAFEPDVRETFLEISRKAIEPEPGLILLRGIFAGWLIALMV